MAEYYVDPTATGDDTGASKTNAWTTMQRCEDGTDGTQPAAGDTVLFRHSGAVGAADETIGVGGVEIGWTGLSGNTTAGYIRYIGVNSAWENDGTQYVLDGDSAQVATGVMIFGTPAYRWFENFLVTRSATSGIVSVGVCLYCIFKNVTASLNATAGISSGALQYGLFEDCDLLHNDFVGLGSLLYGRAIRCRAVGNAFYGIQGGNSCTIKDCLVVANGLYSQRQPYLFR